MALMMIMGRCQCLSFRQKNSHSCWIKGTVARVHCSPSAPSSVRPARIVVRSRGDIDQEQQRETVLTSIRRGLLQPHHKCCVSWLEPSVACGLTRLSEILHSRGIYVMILVLCMANSTFLFFFFFWKKLIYFDHSFSPPVLPNPPHRPTNFMFFFFPL